MRDTSDLEIPGAAAGAASRSSTERVDTAATQASMIAACRARSMRRRGSNTDGMKLPLRSLGIFSSRSPAWVANKRPRWPLRAVVRLWVRS